MASPPPNDFAQDPKPGENKNSSLTLVVYALITVLLLALAYYFASQTRGGTSSPSSSPAELAFTTQTVSPSETAPSTVLEFQSVENPPALETGFAIAAYPPALGTSTGRQGFTPRPSATPTITPTPTATPTRTLVPSLTPAFPLQDDTLYQLANWTPEMASRLIALMEAYPEALSAFARGEDDAGYFAAFQFVDLALREALLRFPSAPVADEWLWDFTYNLARLGDPRAGSYYADLLRQKLNNKNVTLETLYTWGMQQDPSLTIEVIPLEGTPGLLSNSLLKASAGEHGSAFIWLQETPNGFESYPLTSDFNFIHPTAVNHFVADLTGDGVPEVAIFHTSKTGSSTYDLPHVFSFSQKPPIELPFAAAAPPPVGPDFDNHWEPVPAGQNLGDLELIASVFPPCPVTVEHIYRWNGRSFEFLNASYQVDPQPALLSYCSLVVDHSSRVWGIETTIRLMESILPDWPPATDVNGEPYPQDSLDEWRYRLAIYHALLGEQDQARGYASSIIDNPAVPDSSWITPAQEFLDTYQTQRDIYRVCLLSSFCDPSQALHSLMDTLSAGDYPAALDILKSAGVTIRTSGYFDFDSDGTTERWMIIRHLTGEPVEFWILAQTESGVEALFVSTVSGNQPHLTYLDPGVTPPIVLLEPDITFQFERKISSQEPFLVFIEPERQFSSDLTQRRIEEIQAFILSGGDPKQASEDLVALFDSPVFTCNFTLCPQYYYLLGLSYELSGEKDQASYSYLKLWRDYLGSPYATMARLKLARVSAIPSPTSTATPSPSPATTGALGTPSPAITKSPTPSGTLPTTTPTTAGYPYP